MYNVTRCRALCEMLRGIASRGDYFSMHGFSHCTLGYAKDSAELRALGFEPLQHANFAYAEKFFGLDPHSIYEDAPWPLQYEYQLYCGSRNPFSEEPLKIAEWLERNMAYEAWDLAYAEKAEREVGIRETWEWIDDCVIPPVVAEDAH